MTLLHAVNATKTDNDALKVRRVSVMTPSDSLAWSSWATPGRPKTGQAGPAARDQSRPVPPRRACHVEPGRSVPVGAKPSPACDDLPIPARRGRAERCLACDALPGIHACLSAPSHAEASRAPPIPACHATPRLTVRRLPCPAATCQAQSRRTTSGLPCPTERGRVTPTKTGPASPEIITPLSDC